MRPVTEEPAAPRPHRVRRLTRPPQRRPRRDPAPSRWRYRLSRLMLTPLFRSFLRVGLPVVLVLAGVGAWLSSAENRQKISDHVAVIRHVASLDIH